jgi:hypothetical protein
MPYTVDFNTVSTVGLESSPIAAALAGLRAHEARYFKNKYDHDFMVESASNAKTTIDWVHRILKEERDIVISSRPLEANGFQVENIRIAYVFYESGLSINVMYTIDDLEKRAVGFKLSEGMEVPAELASRFILRVQERALTLGSALRGLPSSAGYVLSRVLRATACRRAGILAVCRREHEVSRSHEVPSPARKSPTSANAARREGGAAPDPRPADRYQGGHAE